jgi:hypothetical protein
MSNEDIVNTLENNEIESNEKIYNSVVPKRKSRTKNTSGIPTFGSKIQVWHGNATKTKGGLKKEDLMENKQGKIVSKKKHEMGKLAFKKNNLKSKTPEEMAEMRARKKK